MDTSLTAALSPKNAERLFATMHGFVASGEAIVSGARSCTTAVTGRGGFSRNTSIDWSTEPGPRYEASRNAYDQYHRDQYQSPGPCQAVPLVVGAQGVSKNLQRDCGYRLMQRG